MPSCWPLATAPSLLAQNLPGILAWGSHTMAAPHPLAQLVAPTMSLEEGPPLCRGLARPLCAPGEASLMGFAV